MFLHLFSTVVKPVITHLCKNPITSQDILPPTDFPPATFKSFLTSPILPDVYINKNLHADEVEGSGDIFSNQPGSSILLPLSRMLPFNDTNYFAPQDDIINIFQQLLLDLKVNFTLPNQVYDQEEYDVYLQQMVTDGPLALLIDNQCIDLMFTREFEVRDNFQPYGAVLKLTNDFKLESIEWIEQQGPLSLMKRSVPGDSNWFRASFRFRTTYIFWTTLMHHLVRTHLLYAGSLFTGVTQCLAADHPLRLFLTPFHFRTGRINREAFELLTPIGGVFHRVSGLSDKGLKSALDYAYHQSNLQQVDINLFLPEYQHLPFISNARMLKQTLKTIVSQFIHKYYTTSDTINNDYALVSLLDWLRVEAMNDTATLTYSLEMTIDVITEFIFVVTAHHHWFGDVIGWLANPYFASLSIPECVDIPCRDQTMMTWLLATFVSLPMPKLMSRFTHAQSNSCVDSFFGREYLELLTACQQRMDEENAHRQQPCLWSCPSQLDCSVAI
jgi:hypothetical protein